MRTVVCGACGADLGRLERVGRRDTCARCGVDLHSCRQCRFYDARAYNECAEPQAERVLDKTRGNFCEFFTSADPARAAARTATAPSTAVPVGAGAAPTAAASRVAAPARDPRAELDRLFRKR